MNEHDIELFAIALFKKQGYEYCMGNELQRESTKEVILSDRLRAALLRINPTLPQDATEGAIKSICNLSGANLIGNNELFHKYLTLGIEGFQYRQNGQTKHATVHLIDFARPGNNDFLVVNQLSLKETNREIRLDIVIYVNGLPLAIIELKNPADEKATLQKAFTQLNNYKEFCPTLFAYNAVLVISDGKYAKTSSITASFSRFLAWKTPDEKPNRLELETMINGMFDKAVFPDLIKQFIVFEKVKKEDKEAKITSIEKIKKIAAYHQYYAVNKALESTKKAVSTDGRAGVIWHTQGSGKSLSMVFLSGKLVLALDNPTLVVLTDRNDLDDQLFETFSACASLLRQEPQQAENRSDLERLLKVSSGGVVFTTIQKFMPDIRAELALQPTTKQFTGLAAEANGKYYHLKFPKLSDRKNIIVIADEAHRSQYDFIDGYARNLRDALPNATFIGFTGTPIESADRNTSAVFGEYIDIYDIEQAVLDGATVRIYYESRLAKVNLLEEQKALLDTEFEEITDEAELSEQEKIKAKWKKLEAIVGSKKRLESLAKDLVAHFEKRQEASKLNNTESKAMVVCLSRSICIDLYNQIIALCPDWHNDDDNKGAIKVIMTGSSSDPSDWQPHIRTKGKRKEIGDRLKNPDDELKIVLVRDMWLTGFDAPCLSTLYIDKPMKTHNLMQAIARVNRVFKEKTGGLIVDYIGIASELKKALALYTNTKRKGKPSYPVEDAVKIMLDKYEVIYSLFHGFDFKRYHKTDIGKKLNIIIDAQEHILGLENGKQRYFEQVSCLLKAYALSVPHPKTKEITDDLFFFKTVYSFLKKYDIGGDSYREPKKTKEEIEAAVKQMVEKAIISDEVIDIFDAAGIKKPDISILSDEFLAEVRGMERKNLAFELLKKLLSDEVRKISKKNVAQSKKFSEILETTIRKYQNKSITSAEVIDELLNFAKDLKNSDELRKKLNLTEDEFAFYTALIDNESTVRELGDDILCLITKDLIQVIKDNASIDWFNRQDTRAIMRISIKRILKKYGYPPDKQEKATENVIHQAEILANEYSYIE